MTPVLGFIPVCTTFAALAIIVVVLLLTGIKHDQAEESDLAIAPQPAERPAWWAIALIPVVVAAVLGFLAWCTAGN